jgi:hypothetical protein
MPERKPQRSARIETWRRRFIESLRLVGNTRGAVDTATIEMHLSTVMGATAAGPNLKNLNRALGRATHRTRCGWRPNSPGIHIAPTTSESIN